SASLPLVDNGDTPEPEPEPQSEEGGEAAYTNAAQTPAYQEFTKLVNNRAPTVLRDLFAIKTAGSAGNVEEVQAALDLVRQHFRGDAMSHGALTKSSHQDIAAALNELDGFSNSGEGGESRSRNDVPERPWGPFWEQVLAERQANLDELCLGGDPRKSRH